ncbi:hypothetical protein M9H77_18304 [Catharanthus roseus]|uniref:Uncharacterized protein n=1 Tax=Catharanthus roseus TaxID=4058 RepID=A0ACC0B736_CATRO|nr:hypothetical protein M9H77_18304 [Catharanthus roseus]
MESINPFRIMLFWDSEIARNAYDIANEPNYITYRISKENIKIPRYGPRSLECSNDDEGAFILRGASYEGIHILVKFEPIQQQNIPNTHNRNTTTLPEHITTVTQMVSDEPSMLYSTINNDDDEVDRLDGEDAVSSQSELDDDNDAEEGEFQTPLNPENPVNLVTENIVQQWENS